MASITWTSAGSPRRVSESPDVSLYPVDSSDVSGGSEAPLTSTSAAAFPADSSLLRSSSGSRRRCSSWRQAQLLDMVAEMVLLFLVGVLATVLTFTIDKLVGAFSEARARLSQDPESFLSSYAAWIGSSIVLCLLSAACVQLISPHAAGSGVPQMKCALAGTELTGYLSIRTLLAKFSSMVLALVGGLSIGKEGPNVHMASCIANQLCHLRPFRHLAQDAHLRRQVLAAGCAAGVSATFGAPVGGVLFSIEVTSTYYSISHLWKAMFTSVSGAVAFQLARDYGSLSLFHLTDFETQDLAELMRNGEMYAFLLLGVLCGVLGAAFVHATSSLVLLVRQLRTAVLERQAALRSRRAQGGARCAARGARGGIRGRLDEALASDWALSLSGMLLSRYGYTLLAAVGTAMLTFPFGFFRSSTEEVVNDLFGAKPFDFTAHWSHPSLLANLVMYTLCKFAFTVLAVTCPISCGVFTPVFLIGAAFGRGFGEVINVFTPIEGQITAGAYAVVGAAAMAAGVTRTISCAVMVFELTGQLNHMLPILVAVLAAYGTGNAINSSFYDTMLELNELPFTKPPNLHQIAHLQAQHVMDRQILTLGVGTCTYLDAHALLRRAGAEREFAVVDGTAGGCVLIGTIRRAALQRLLERRLHGGGASSAPAGVAHSLRKLRGSLTESLQDIFSPEGRAATPGSGTSSGTSSRAPTPAVDGAPAIASSSVAIGVHSFSSPAAAEEAAAEAGPPEAGGAGPGGAASASARAPMGARAEQEGGIEEGGGPAGVGGRLAEGSSALAGGGVGGADEAALGELTEEQAALLAACGSLELGDLGAGAARSAAHAAAACPSPRGRERGAVGSAASLVDLAPVVLTAGTPMQQVYMQFSLLGLERAYVTFAGQLIGVIRRQELQQLADQGNQQTSE